MNPTRLARAAGLGYCGIFFLGIFAEVFVRGQVKAPGDAARTAANILAHESLFRLGFLADLDGVVFFFLSALALHTLLKRSGVFAATLFLLLVVISAAITSLNLLNPLMALFLLTGDYMLVFSRDQVQALAYAFLDLHKSGYLVAQVFFGAWLFPLGYLVFKTRMAPRVLAILLMLSGSGHLAEVLVQFLFPRLAPFLSPIALTAAVLGEPPFFLWLLFKGAIGPLRTPVDIRPSEDKRPAAGLVPEGRP